MRERQEKESKRHLLKTAIYNRKTNLVCMAVAIGIYVLNKTFLIQHTTGMVNYFCRCHLNDFVCPLFFLGYCQILFLWIGYEIKSYWKCMLLIMAAGFVWEYIAPQINPHAISDPWDLVCYFVGGNVYFLMIKCEQGRK